MKPALIAPPLIVTVRWLSVPSSRRPAKLTQTVRTPPAILPAHRPGIPHTKINEVLEDESEEDQDGEVPGDLRKQIEEHLEGHPSTSWDKAVRDLVEAEEVDAAQ